MYANFKLGRVWVVAGLRQRQGAYMYICLIVLRGRSRGGVLNEGGNAQNRLADLQRIRGDKGLRLLHDFPFSIVIKGHPNKLA